MKSKESKTSQTAWQAGVAKMDITPTENLWLHGWGSRTKPMQGVSLPIHAKALALRDETGHTAVLVTADILGFSAEMTATIVEQARKRHGLERSQLILNASHNHSGPMTTGVLPLYFELSQHFANLRERYTQRLLNQVVELIGAAINNLSPANLAFGQGLAGMGVNRRRARAGGRCLPTVVDQDVPVLTVTSGQGELRAIAFGYSCHPTCIEDGKINGDWPGYAQAALEKTRPGTTALFVQGCGGDINPLPRFRPGLGEHYGDIIASAVEQVLESQVRDRQLSGQPQGGELRPLAGPLRTTFSEAQLPFEKLPSREELLSLLPSAVDCTTRAVHSQLSFMADGQDHRPRALRYPIHVWRFGDGLKLIALSSETVADYSLRLKQMYGWENTWVSGYNDDYWCYIPSRRVLEEGGYEGHTGMLECSLPGPFAPCVEEVIVEKIDELVQESSGQPRAFPRPSKHE